MQPAGGGNRVHCKARRDEPSTGEVRSRSSKRLLRRVVAADETSRRQPSGCRLMLPEALGSSGAL